MVHCRGKHEARFELVVMQVSVNSGAVGGGFRVHSCRSHRRLMKAGAVHVFLFLFFLKCASIHVCVHECLSFAANECVSVGLRWLNQRTHPSKRLDSVGEVHGSGGVGEDVCAVA